MHESLGTNKTHEWSLGGGDVEQGLADADVVVERRIVNHRTSGAPIEPRGVVAEFRAGQLTVWTSTQVPHFVRLFYAVQMGISEDKIRVIAPEVGGGFGAKLQVTAEETICAWAARKLGRPVKWIETRSEHMMVCHHGRDQINYVRMGAMRDGTITTIHTRIIADLGAYFGLLTPAVPSLSAFVMAGCYRFANVKTDVTGVFTNKYATDAIRGAGRPEATHAIEMMIDQVAVRAGHGPDRGAAQELHPEGAVPLRDALRRGLRLRRLRAGDGPDARDGRPPRVPPRAGGAASEGRSTAGSASRRTPRSAGWRPRGSPGPAGSACRPACSSRRSCACTRRDR